MKKPKKKNSLGNVISTMLLIISLCVFAYAAYQLIVIYLAYKTGVDEYKDLNQFFSAERIIRNNEVEYEGEEIADDNTGTQGAPSQEEYIPSDDEVVCAIDDAGIITYVPYASLPSYSVVRSSNPDEIIPVIFPDREQYTQEKEPEPEREEGTYLTLLNMENPVDFDSLCKINSEVVGWLEMEAIDISYPLVQGEDNDYYLHRTFQKTDNFAGSIFMDYTNRSDFSDRNTILYGHNMKNGSMFGILKNYRDPAVYEKSPYFWIYTPNYIFQYEIISCAEIDKYSDTYLVSFNNAASFLEYLYQMKDQSLISTKAEVTSKDHVVTLSTCTGNDATRFVVQGKMVNIYRAVPKAGGYEEQ